VGKSKGSTTQTTGPDAATAARAAQVWAAAQGAANQPGAPVDPMTTAAGAGFQNYANAGKTGIAALTGDPAAFSQFMDPYQSNVIDQLHQQFNRMRTGATNDVNAAATQAGAFGGSRHGVAQGVQLGQLDNAEGQQTAGILDTGFNNSMGRASTAANLGFGANGAMASLGDYMRNVNMQNDPNMRQYSILAQALGMIPGGSTSVGTQQNGRNGATGALGGAATGAQIGSSFGPWGTGVGAGLGGLLGMFS
jgi:hypothetical protein